MEGLTNRFDAQEAEFKQAFKDYEELKLNMGINEDEIVKKVSAIKKELFNIKFSISEKLQDLELNDQLAFSKLSVEIEAMDNVLNEIGFAILGKKEGLISFKVSYFSTKVSTILKLEEKKLKSVVDKLNAKIPEASKIINGEKTDTKKDDIIMELNAINTEFSKIITKISQAYLKENSVAEMHGQELNLDEKYKALYLMNYLVSIMNFISQLLEEISN